MRSLPGHADYPLSLASVQATTGVEPWSFTYCFFTNHLPFLAPNRSEPCPPR